MLSSMSEEDGKLIDAISKSEEMDIFVTDLVIDLIEFRWHRFARNVHLFGFYCHVSYIFCLFVFVGNTYGDISFYGLPKKVILGVMFLLLIYPLKYDGT